MPGHSCYSVSAVSGSATNKKVNKTRQLCNLVLVLFFQTAALSYAAGTVTVINLTIKKLPRIQKLDSNDILFSQYGEDVEQAYMDIAKGKNPQQLFYAYTTAPSDTLFSIAARCSIPYETIATLNTIPSTDTPVAEKTLILPTVAGVFVPRDPSASIEILLQKKYAGLLEEQKNICYTLDSRIFYFLENERFGSTERAFFLDSSMKMPLSHYWISSSYGMRVSPITGKWKFHEGIDLAAPQGTSVFACKSGIVVQCREHDPVYGNYIILRHSNGMSSVYAHLSYILVKKGESVSTGTEIGKVGMTGEATGPHLHFEIRINDISTNPEKLLKERK